MFKNYLVTSWRNLLRNKVFSFINILGLAVGLAVGFLIYQYVQVEKSYDRFHTKADRIYRVPIAYSGSFSSIPPSATNHPAIGPAMKADFPEVEDYARLVRASLFLPAATVTYNQGSSQEPLIFNEEKIYLADASFLKIFSFPMVEGNASALDEPSSVVLTKRIAQKYFGNESAIGKFLTINRHDFKITGVLDDIPENSHLQFDFLVSFSILGDKFGHDVWTWPEFYNYVLLAPGTNATTLESKFPKFMEKYLAKVWEEYKFKSSISLQPITDIHLKSDLGLEQSVNSDERSVYFMSLLAIFVLVIAWINYVNLSTAKSLERSKEVGLRKVAGASKKQLITQFFFDALLINIIAVLVAAILLIVTMPYFENIAGKNISGVLSFIGAWHSLSFWALVVGGLLLGVLVVGLYPALLISSFNPALVLKGKFSKSRSGTILRKTLVSFQYVLSIFLIAGAITIYEQMKFMHETDLGYNKDQMLIVRSAATPDSTYASQLQYFRNELLQMPAIDAFTSSDNIPGQAVADRNSIYKLNQDEKDKVGTYFISVDNQFLDTYQLKLAAGRNFGGTSDRFISTWPNRIRATPDGYLIGGGQNKVLINEILSQQLGFETPADAVNQSVKLRLGQSLYVCEVIGVVKNHHQVSLRHSYDPIVYFYPEFDFWKYFSVRVNTRDLQSTISKVKDLYAESFPGNAFEYFFLNEHFDKQYKNDQQFGTIFTVFTVLAIIISSLGLLGLGIFAVTQRTKEIGIRKTLGASVSGILILFSGDSIRILIISYVISIPAIYFAVDSWLNNFAFHISMGWQMFLAPPLFLLIISVATIASITIRAALLSPAHTLRHE